MYKIKIITIGKTKEPWLKEAIKEYTHRLQANATIEWILAKNNTQLNDILKKEPHFICLDSRGEQLTSEKFSAFLIRQLNAEGGRVTFVIGGPEGVSQAIAAKAAFLLSFSRLTFTHQMIRLLLIEQFYRALEIEKGSPYHKK